MGNASSQATPPDKLFYWGVASSRKF